MYGLLLHILNTVTSKHFVVIHYRNIEGQGLTYTLVHLADVTSSAQRPPAVDGPS